MKVSGIYKITSIIKPDRIYVGSAVNINQRKYLHFSQLKNKKHHSKKLQNHVNKYGIEDLEFSIIEECNIEHLINKEQYYLDNINPYFNICKFAGSTFGVKCSKESNIKRKKFWNEKVWTDEERKNFDFSDRKTLTEEGRQKISECNKNKTLSEETKKKISLSKKGKPNYKLKGRIFSEETKAKISKANKGRITWTKGPLTEEHKQKIREGIKRRKENMVL